MNITTRTRELITLLPTQFRRVSSISGLYAGHHIPLLGTWSKSQGYIKKQSLRDDNIGESLACPIIAVVSNKFGNKDVTLTITAKKSTFKYNKETVRGDYTITRKIYEPTEETITSTLRIPRYTRPYATFLITGLGRMVYEITSITDNVDFDVGEIEFYALASSGSKIVYWLGIHQLAEQLRTILRPWIAPPKCNRCGGTGIEPDTLSQDCKQCLGYGYDGYSAEAYVQRKIGFDVGLARKILDWDNMDDDDHEIVKKFINKAWTQKWWVTPTVGEIKRMISHFYMLDYDDIEIIERFHPQEPVWSIFLPIDPDTNAPFGQQTLDDQEMIKYVAESVTPAGVSVFMGFYEIIPESLGDLDMICHEVMFEPRPITSWDHEYSLWGAPRFDFMNGWVDAVIDFEPASPGMPPKNGSYKSVPDDPIDVEETFNDYSIPTKGDYYATYSFEDDTDGSVPAGWTDSSGAGCTAQVISDLGGHNKVLELDDDSGVNQCIINSDTFTGVTSGTLEWWWRIDTAAANHQFIFGLSDGSYPGYTGAFVLGLRSGHMQYYDWGEGGWSNLPTDTTYIADTWYHMKLEVTGLNAAHIYVDSVDKGAITSDGVPTAFDRLFAYTWTADSGHTAYIDAIGYSWDSNYEVGWNKNAYDHIEETKENDWNYNGVIEGDHTIVNDGGKHNKVLKIEENSDTGIYPATFNFMDDDIGDVPNGWVDVSTNTCSATITATVGGHNKVLDCDDTDNGGVYVIYDFQQNRNTDGDTIEFWYRSTDCSKTTEVRIYNDNAETTIGAYLHFADDGGGDQFSYINSVGGVVNVLAPADNTWYHMKLVFDFTNNTFDWYIDGVLKAENAEFSSAVTKMREIFIVTSTTALGWHSYFDAFGFSWDDNYIVSDNEYEVGAQIYKQITEVTDKKINFYMKGDLHEYARCYLMNDDVILSSFKVESSDLFYTDGDDWVQGAVVNNEWHLMTVDLNVDDKTYDLYFKGELQGTGIEFQRDTDYYKGTYNFKFDELGSDPAGWTTDESGLQSVQVISELGGHEKVLELFDTTSGDHAIANQTFSSKTSGTVEFWYRKGGHHEDTHIRLKDSGGSIAAHILAHSGEFQYHNGALWNTITTYSMNTWYHFRIDFECASGGYMGLAADTMNIYVDGVKYVSGGSFYQSLDSIEVLFFGTRGLGTNNDFYAYVDAVGYSWDDNYEIGDNLNKNDLFEYVYPATYNFYRDKEGQIPLDWEVDETGGTVRIIDGLQNHEKIVEMDDTDGANAVELNQYFDGQATGTIEFWFRMSATDQGCGIYVEDGGPGSSIQLYFQTDATVDTTTENEIFTYEADKWYHFRIEWDCNDDWHLWIDGVSIDGGTGYAFNGAPTEMDTLYFYTYNAAQFTVYVDAVGYSWDSDYDVGDNENYMEGIKKLFFETESNNLDYDVYCDCITIDTKMPLDHHTTPLIENSGYLYSNPHAEDINVNDRFRHECRLRGSGAYFDILYENYQLTGTFEWWWHPVNSDLRNSFYDRNNAELFYVEYVPSAKGVDCGSGLIDLMMPNNDQHVRVDFGCTQSFCGKYITGDYDVYINRNLKYSGSFTGSEGIYHNKFHNTSQGTGFIDSLGWNYGSGATGGYSVGNNWGTCYEWGWGSKHENCVDGVCGLLEHYFRREKVILS